MHPVVLKVIDISVHLLLNSLVLTLSLSVHLGIVYAIKVSIDVQVMAESYPEF